MSQKRSQALVGSIAAADGGSIDAFSRWRVSEPTGLFDSQQQFGLSDLIWAESTNGAGTITNSLARASTLLSSGGTTSGDFAYMQTKTHFRYQPGKSQLIIQTFLMGTERTNGRERVGYFDDRNGIFLERFGGAVYLGRRTYTSGSTVDNHVAQSSWNIDPFDGSGPSGITLDLSKTQILVIDLQWLGVGRVRVGFDIDGLLYYVHEFLHANVLDVVYMQMANLPLRAEARNEGVTSGAVTFEYICSQVASEGGFDDERGLQFSANRGATALSISAKRPVLSIRAKTAGPNAVRNTGQIIPKSFSVMGAGNEVLVEIYLNPTTITGASWNSVDANRSLAEYDVAATAITGGILLDTFFIATGRSAVPSSGQNSPFNKFPLVYSNLDSHQDILSIVMTPSTASSTIWAGLNWQELY